MKAFQLSKLLASAVIAASLVACAGTPKQESTGEYLDDTVLTAKVKSALLNDPTVSGLAVNVESFKGTVQLSGFVKSADEREKAVQVARKVGGVKQIRNDILLR